jgi:hypothetical protein
MGNRVQTTGDVLTVHGVKTFEKRCDGCRYWVSPDHPGDVECSFYEAGRFGYCKIACSKNGEPENRRQLAFAIDYGEESAHLRTKPEFSCSQWQEKEARSDD